MTKEQLVLPSEYYTYERDGNHLIFDPRNFIWFVTDGLGKEVFDSLARFGNATDAIEDLSRITGISDSSLNSYVSKYVKHLLDIGFLHEGEYKQEEWHGGILERPKILYLHVTSKCNLKCPYCYNQEHRFQLIQLTRKASEDNRYTEAATEGFLRVVDEAAGLGFSEVKITGGEALLNKDVVLIAERAKSHGMAVNLLTNATLITEELSKRIARAVDSVSISLDSDDPEEHDIVRGKGTHAKVLEAIRLLKAAGTKRIHLNAVITPVNKNSVGNFLNYAWNEIKANEVTISGAGINVDDPSGRWEAAKYMLTGEDYQHVYEQERKFYQIQRKSDKHPTHRSSLRREQCGVGNGLVSVDANGDVYPCQTMHSPEFKCGNVFETGLAHILETSGVIKKMKSLVVDILPECNTCPMRYICSGGCRQEAYSREGNLLARNREMCPTYFRHALDQLWDAASVPVQNLAEVTQKYQPHHSCH